MRTSIIILVLGLILLSEAQIIPCGRCVGKFEVCVRDSCGWDLKCMTKVPQPADPIGINPAPICYPVLARNASCDDSSKLYVGGNPCPDDFSCVQTGFLATDKTCQPSRPYAELGDNCLSSLYCVPPLVCNGGTCKNPNADGSCMSDQQCPFQQYCSVDFTVTPPTGSCKALATQGQSCNTTGCAQPLYCDPNSRVCTAYFTVGLGGTCQNSVMCKTGYYCNTNDGTCQKPPYHLLITSTGGVWGPPCIPRVNGADCVCNPATASYQYLKESSSPYVYRDVCPQRYNDLVKCMTDNKCHSINLGADTCFRDKCYEIYKAGVRDCQTPDGVAQFCGANSLFIYAFLILLALLI